jgi:hypothetical protein
MINLNPGASMDIWMIWARDSADPQNVIWLEEAWDDDSVGNNPDGWREAVDKAYERFGGANVRITRSTVNFDKVQAAFEPAQV